MDSWRVFDFNCAAPRVTQVLNKNIGTCVQTHSHRLTWTLHYSLGLVVFFQTNQILQSHKYQSSNNHIASVTVGCKPCPSEVTDVYALGEFISESSALTLNLIHHQSFE